MSGSTYPQIDVTKPMGPVADCAEQRANWAATQAQLQALWNGAGPYLAVDPVTGSLTTPLVISTAAKPTLTVDVPDDTGQAAIQLCIGGSPRWVMHTIPGPETGGNTGTDFAIGRFNDNGTYLSDMVNVSRQTGEVSLYGDLVAYGTTFQFTNSTSFAVGSDPVGPLEVVTKQYADALVAPLLARLAALEARS